jgi:periplasmic protein CpxP/Spy
MSKMKLLSIAVIGLLILNLGIVGFLFFSKPLRPLDRPNGRPPFERIKPQNEIIEGLHFDSDQVRQYEILIEEHQVSIRTLNDSIRNVKSMLYLMLNAENISDKDSLIETLGSLQKGIERIHYEHFAEVKKLCRADQLSDFEELTTRLAGFFGRQDQGKRRE